MMFMSWAILLRFNVLHLLSHDSGAIKLNILDGVKIINLLVLIRWGHNQVILTKYDYGQVQLTHCEMVLYLPN